MNFLFFLIIDLNFLIAAVITQTFNPTVELVVPIGITTKEAKAKIGIHPVIAEAKIRKCSIYLKIVQTFLCLLVINSFWSITLTKQFFIFSIFFNPNS